MRTKQDIINTYETIKVIIDAMLDKYNVLFEASLNAPSTYKAMRSFFDDNGYFLVYNGGDHGYLGEEYNIKFRALHDAMHYKYNLSFKFEDEKQLSDITANEFFKYAYDNLGATHYEIVLTRDIITAEIKGQIEYYERYNSYVADQVEFIDSYFNAMQ